MGSNCSEFTSIIIYLVSTFCPGVDITPHCCNCVSGWHSRQINTIPVPFATVMLTLTYPTSRKILHPLLKPLTFEAQLLDPGWRLGDDRLEEMVWGVEYLFITRVGKPFPSILKLFSWHVDAVDRGMSVGECMRILGYMCEKWILERRLVY